MKNKTIYILSLLILIPTLCMAGGIQDKLKGVISKNSTLEVTPTWTYVNKNGTVGKETSLTGVTSGNTIVAMLQWADAATTPTLSDGTNNPTGYANVVIGGTRQYIRIAYWLSSPKSGSVTYTWTSAGGGGYTAHVFELNCNATPTLIDSHINLGANENGTTATSATSPSTSETAVAAFGGAGFYNDETLTSATIDGSAVDQSIPVDDTGYAAWGILTMRLLNNPGTYASAVTVNSGADWAADAIGFKCN